MKKNKGKKNKRLVLLLILVLGISIGYAALASNLKINGASKVNSASWIIHWANPQVVSGSVTDTKPTLSENNTNATYSVTLNKPGDFYEFTIDAVNEGTIDAEILKIESRFDGPDGTPIVTDGEHKNLPAYLEYEVTYADEGHTPIAVKDSLDHGQSKKYRVRVAYSENITADDLQDDDITTTFYFEVEYKQKDKDTSTTSDDDVIKIVDKDPDDITTGDEVTIGEGDTTQPFIVVDVDDDKVVLLAKYNLSTYATTLGSTQFYQYDGSPYIGIGSENLGQYPYIDDAYDDVPFSKTLYWSGNLATYTNNYVYDSTRTGAPVFDAYYDCVFDGDPNCLYSSEYGREVTTSFTLNEDDTPDNYSVAYYISHYKQVLEGMGAPIQEVRLLSREEATPLVNGGLLKYNGSLRFWLGTAYNNSDIYYVDVVGHDDDPAVIKYQYAREDGRWGTYFNYCGVRPAVVVNKSDIK